METASDKILSESFARADLLDTAPCGYLCFDDSGRITDVNSTLSDMLGHTRESLLSLHIDQILTVPSRIFYQTHLFPLLRLKGEISEVYFTLKCTDGSKIEMLSNGRRREADGETLNDLILLAMRERSEYEDEILRAKRAAESAVIAKDEFIAGVSHELRTPLNSILGWVGILNSVAPDADRIAQGLGAIERSTRSLNRLIEDLLDYTRIVSGKLQLNLRQVDMKAAVAGAADIVRPAVEAKSIALLLNIEHDAPIVSGDADRLQQVLWNILSNAIKFTPDNGQVYVDLMFDGSAVEITIADTGRGISEEFLPYVFDRFQQGKNEGRKRSSGIGLGMAISKYLVELHGGTIKAESEGEGKGAKFTVRLPVAH